MTRKLKNTLEIYQLLEKSDCKQCGEKTCLAFAGAVFLERRQLQDCPRLSPEMLAAVAAAPENLNALEPGCEYLNNLKAQIARLDLAAAADRVGGSFAGDRLTVKVLGKDFSVDTAGNLSADIHINPWIAGPFLNYVLSGQGLTPTGKWVSLRELKEGRERYPLFQRRSEQALQQVADNYPDLFDDIVRLFAGKQVPQHFDSDISVVLHPLPKVPVMICYWRPEEDLASNLLVFFDDTADHNLDVDSVFNLGVGMAHMFKKIALRHGFAGMG